MVFFFLNDTATPEIYPLPQHDALPICRNVRQGAPRHDDGAGRDARSPVDPRPGRGDASAGGGGGRGESPDDRGRSEEHTSELQSRQYLVCRLLLEKKKKTRLIYNNRVG